MRFGPRTVLLGGALAAIGLALGAHAMTGGRLIARLEADAAKAAAQSGVQGVSVRFENQFGMATRHPLLIGGTRLPDAQRARVARAVAAVPGVGGVYWADSSIRAQSGAAAFDPLHCQEDVEALLRTRSIRFRENSEAILAASRPLLDEVAAALRPCGGAIIAIDGHSDARGDEAANARLSLARARAVREALVSRGIPRSGLRARGLGATQPVEGLDPGDPANRRIEFKVVRVEPLAPTPVDTPGAR